MTLFDRLAFAIRAWVNDLLNRTADPSAELDYSYEQMRDELQEVNRGIADLTTQKKRLELHRERLRSNAEKHDQQVREAVRQDRDDLARRALEKKHAVTDQLADLDEQIERLQATQDRLVQRQVDFRGRIEGFRTHKETLKARHEAARASARVAEAFSGVGGEMGDVNRAVERASERTEQMEARAAALEELEETGALDDILSDGDEIDRELERRSTEQRIDSELEELKTQLGRETEPADVEEATD
ncbi:PspA/IM30 family protein [Halomicrobium salinisoli]|uniref:PspA/IM30 family protein n=1 Tax=Halomicrobium salinisoli TaxID=2878391 RepID=UPI001CEFCACF|nr:PspA/IM30 family protein [Halomicrobium salinisoli]